jgi:serine/threonine protein kinase/Tfp pilus assembly protein PilF
MADQALAGSKPYAGASATEDSVATRPQNWEAIKALFDAALEEDSTHRSAFLKERCADGSVCAEVERLLAEHDQAGAFLSTPALDDLPLSATGHSQRLREGELLAGRFRIVRFIAAGGMGEVYEAEDQELHEPVAIKIIRTEILAQPNAVARFKREVNVARKVTHPNVCRIFDLFRHKSDDSRGQRETAFISMELLHGKTLAERLKAGRLDVSETLPLVEQMAAALSAAHAVGVVHRDFKPGNVVLVGTPGQWRSVVTDFGLALRSLTADEGATHSTGQTFLGTPAYMSPEQLEGRPATPASDVYALGLVMYEMVTGARPFLGDTPISAALKRLTETPAPPRRLQPGLSGVWESVILRCLERDPAQRFKSVADIPAALRDQKTGSLRGNLAGEQLVPDALSEARTSEAVRLTNRRKYLPSAKQSVWAACIVFAIVAVVLGYRSWRNRSHESGENARTRQLAATQVQGPPAGSFTTSRRAIRIAVLPFENKPTSPEFRRLSDTIADELASELAQGAEKELRVLAASSTLGFTSAKAMPAQVAQELNARYLVEGNVDCFNRKATCSRSLLELKVRVVDAAGQIQGEQTYLPQGNFSKTPAEIAEWVARTIQVKLLPETATGSQIGGTTNPDAYNFYLQGRYEFSHGLEPKAYSDFQEAIAIDPNYALAHAEIAKIHIFRANNEQNRAELVAAKDEAKIALGLDDRVAQAHSDLAWVLYNNDFDWAGAEAEYLRALALNPSDTFAHKWYAMFLAGQGRGREAVDQAEQALSLDPASMTLKAAYGWILIDAGQTDAGIDYLEKELELYPDYGVGSGYLGTGYNRRHEYEKAALAFQRAADVAARLKLKAAYLAYRCGVAANLGLAGKTDQASKIAAQIRKVWDDGTWVPACNLALMYFGIGDNDAGFKFLRRGLQERSCTLHEINTEPILRTRWDDPVFKDIRSEFHLPDSPPSSR